ncbi:STAS domain-containing protein [Goodfellowiella coeruleoviolacea]|uniref:Anti-sigma factor antagonist n=1 Tax=Goodfellowiella coeruleoviolacea TaxID=334858 RepID=A0AAE3KLG0_9PSEU|nr:STAS domain-containing protein [Goodfellowiella coeruleoviolacea]MCP2166508.1 anti-anti-sigma factor [Goodfellowiella coeruleoviolacea]
MTNEERTEALEAPSVAVGRVDGTEGLLALHGEIDHGTASQIDEVVQRLLDEGATSLVVDFTDLTFFDSACLSSLIRAHTTITERGGTMTLTNVSRHARRVLDITGLLPLFQLTDESA